MNIEPALNEIKDVLIAQTMSRLGDLKDYADEVKKEMNAAFEKSEERLKKWTTLLENGEITQKEFEFLSLALKDPFEIVALKVEGIKRINREKFLKDLICDIVNIIVGAVCKKQQA